MTDYKTFATVQTLLSEWRSQSPDLSVIGKFEPELHGHLLKEKKIKDLEELKSTDVNHLVVEIMRKKIEEKFGEQLNKDQLILLREYVFSNDNKETFLKKLSAVKDSTLVALDSFKKTCTNKIIENQIPNVRKSVLSLSTSTADDETLSRYLTLMKLTEELTTGDEANG